MKEIHTVSVGTPNSEYQYNDIVLKCIIDSVYVLRCWMLSGKQKTGFSQVVKHALKTRMDF